MNSTSNNITIASNIDEIIQEDFNFYQLFYSSITLLIYNTLLNFPQEKEYIWLKPFSLITWLYIFTRYGTLVQQVLLLVVSYLPLGRTCNTINDLLSFAVAVSHTGIQGLLVARAYALCGRGKIPAVILAFGFFSGLILLVYGFIAFPGCLTSLPAGPALLELAGGICVIFTDISVFIICIWKVWGVWKLKREAGIENRDSLVSVILQQSVLRCCFVIVITITDVVLLSIQNLLLPGTGLSQGYNILQNALSGILVADFTLDLRSLNSAKIEASNASLPSLQFSNVLHRIHQVVTVEFATPDENIDIKGHAHQGPVSVEDLEIQPAQD